MIALILNSGLGKRMGHLTSKYPKCMSNIGEEETILSRQLKQVQSLGIKKVVITTGLFDEVLVDYCKSLSLDIEYKFVITVDMLKQTISIQFTVQKSLFKMRIFYFYTEI